jgi:hypothetical protein
MQDYRLDYNTIAFPMPPNYSCNEVSAHTLERDNLLRFAFMNTIADIVTNPDMLMFVDKAAHNKKTSAGTRG